MVFSFFVELTLVDFLTALISHDAHVAFAVLKFTREFITVFVLVNTAFFLTVNEGTNESLLILKVLERSLDLYTFYPGANERRSFVFEGTPAVLKTFLPRALINITVRVKLEYSFAAWLHTVIKTAEVNPIWVSLLPHCEDTIPPNPRNRISIQPFENSLAFLEPIYKITAISLSICVFLNSIPVPLHIII